MGNSIVYRIHTGRDLIEVYRMARQLLGLREIGCCRAGVRAAAQTGSHRLAPYREAGFTTVSLTVPAALVDEIAAAWGEPLRRDRRGNGHLVTGLTGELAEVLRPLPEVGAEVDSPEEELDGDLPQRVLAMAGPDPVVISWDVCWPGNHGRSGFELGLNGAELWHPESPPGHSLYLHVHPSTPERADVMALVVGGRVLGEPATGW